MELASKLFVVSTWDLVNMQLNGQIIKARQRASPQVTHAYQARRTSNCIGDTSRLWLVVKSKIYARRNIATVWSESSTPFELLPLTTRLLSDMDDKLH